MPQVAIRHVWRAIITAGKLLAPCSVGLALAVAGVTMLAVLDWHTEMLLLGT